MSNEQPTVTTESGSGAGTEKRTAERTEDLTGRLLSERYLIEGSLGSGGMGEVYRAEHTLMKKKVAVKVLRPDVVGHGEAVERFRREAQAAAHIDHPNICVATDFGEMGEDGFFLVMEYLEGNTLDETLVCVERFEPARALHIAEQICAALRQAHSLGVVHRDLKPENVMLVERDGDHDFVKIMDFGVARVRIGDDGSSAKITLAGRIYGTPHYMSPEQAAGATDIDQRADLYSLGVMLFEMLTGTLPFVDKSPTKVMAMHMTEDPPSIRERVPEAGLPRRLDKLIQRLMAKEPADRPSSAEQVQEELGHIGEAGNTESWFAVTRDAADTGTMAIRSVAKEVAPRIQSARGWVNQNSIVRGVAMGAFALLLAALLVAPVVYLVWPNGGATSPEARQQEAKSLTEARTQFLDEVGAGDVVSTLATGDPAEAVARLETLAGTQSENAHLEFLLARANAGVGDWTAALAHYEQALELEPRYASEDRLVNDVVARFSAGDDEQVERAERILLDHLPETVGSRRLSALARLGGSGKIRSRARDALAADNRMDTLDAWNRASIELRFARGCDAHRAQIEAIVESGDARGLEVLRFYERQPTTGCGTFKRDDCYGCIRKDLAEAIATLEEANPEAEEAEAAASQDVAE